jgi:hypothetical protein
MQLRRLDDRRSLRSIATSGVLAASACCTLLALGGCCEDERKKMDEMLLQYYSRAFACCVEINKNDPAAGTECFQKLADWQKRAADAILDWYRACVDEKSATANEILELLKGLASEATGTCGSAVRLADGRVFTVGTPFDADDTLEFSGAFEGAFGLLKPPVVDAPRSFALADGRLALDIDGIAASLATTGAITVSASGKDRFSIDAFTFSIDVGNGTIDMTLDDDEGRSSVVLDGSRGLLEVRVAVASTGEPALFVPEAAWLRIPVRATANGLALDLGEHRAVDVVPPAPGIADWNGDTFVDLADWTAFHEDPARGERDLRDLDLDGDVDPDDVAMFGRLWREAMRVR